MHCDGYNLSTNHKLGVLTYSVANLACTSADDIELSLDDSGLKLHVCCDDQTVVLCLSYSVTEGDLRCRFFRDTACFSVEIPILLSHCDGISGSSALSNEPTFAVPPLLKDSRITEIQYEVI